MFIIYNIAYCKTHLLPTLGKAINDIDYPIRLKGIPPPNSNPQINKLNK